MKLIVGLGNPGDKYKGTRHNCGFMAIEKIEEILNVKCDKVKFKGVYTKCKYQGEDLVLLKPMTFMNNSGESVQEVMRFFKIDIEDVVVLYDDLDLPVGKIRLRVNGGAGGHNGMKSIIQHVNTQNFKRIRIGIDKHPYMAVVDYVLSTFTTKEEKDIDSAIEASAKAALTFVSDDFTKAMNQFN